MPSHASPHRGVRYSQVRNAPSGEAIYSDALGVLTDPSSPWGGQDAMGFVLYLHGEERDDRADVVTDGVPELDACAGVAQRLLVDGGLWGMGAVGAERARVRSPETGAVRLLQLLRDTVRLGPRDGE
ncbi:hypothetical protein V496_06124 [Pseudogymnoascus sp. VKM F-4515 (FW-2607)]|nr:hypothetical protein V496_06124 [Pseudogymnoascus sp. VKM F-4515 (FW-2607)]